MTTEQLKDVRATMLATAQWIQDFWEFDNERVLDRDFRLSEEGSNDLSKAVAYGRWRALVEMVEMIDQGHLIGSR